MRYLLATSFSLVLLLLASCTLFQGKEPAKAPEQPKKILVAPIGKHWQVMEEAPTLTNERHERTLPFQTEQSIEPPGAQPVTPTEQRKIETPR